MSTKKPDGKAFDAGAWFASRQREDVTNDYKYPESRDIFSICLHTSSFLMNFVIFTHPLLVHNEF